MTKNTNAAQHSDNKESKKSGLSTKTKIIVGLFCLLCVYYLFLRFQESQDETTDIPPSAIQAISSEEPVFQTAEPEIVPEPVKTEMPPVTPKPAANQSSAAVSTPSSTPIPYQLMGKSGQQKTDANGNIVDTSNHLTSIGKPSDVLPKGFSLDDIPYYYGDGVIEINDNVPFFTDEEIELAEQGAFEYYGTLDKLGRCTVAFDCLGRETMPNGAKRGNISSIHPSGWKQARYDCVDSETVMTRAHLAGYMMSSENANECNLISGTRYMNSDTMLPYEEAAANWLSYNSGKHILYRVTPWYEGNNLMADGILMEARSVEDLGRGIQFCVYVYNVQPGLKFNYATGRSQYSGIFFDTDSDTVITDGIHLGVYGLDLSSDTIHTTKCSVFSSLDDDDKVQFSGDRNMQNEWPSMGYHLCSKCLK